MTRNEVIATRLKYFDAAVKAGVPKEQAFEASKKLTAKALKANDKKIEQIYYKNCSGVQIDIMDIGKVFAEGHKAIAEGADDAALTERIVAVVQTIRKN